MHPLSDDDLRFMVLVLASVPFVLWTAVKRYREKAPPLFPHPATMRLLVFGWAVMVVFSIEGLLEHFGNMPAAVEQRLNAIVVPVVIFGSIAVLAGWFRRAGTLGKESVGFLVKLHAPDKADEKPPEPGH
jgi:hypothetical protein